MIFYQNKNTRKFLNRLEDLINKSDYIIGSKVNEFEEKFSNL